MNASRSSGWWVVRALSLAACLTACGAPDDDTVAPKNAPALNAAPSLPHSGNAEKFVTGLRARLTASTSGLSAEDAVDAGLLLQRGPAERFEIVTEGLRPIFAAPGVGAVRVFLPPRATAPLRLEDLASELSVEVSLIESRDVQGEAAEGYVVYRGAHRSGATMLWRALPDGSEDYFSFETRPQEPSVSYSVALRHRVAGLRLVENTLEVLDAGGAPRLRVAPPFLVDVNGKRTDATLSIEGCAFDASPAAPWGRPVMAPGAETCVLHVSWKIATSSILPSSIPAGPRRRAP